MLDNPITTPDGPGYQSKRFSVAARALVCDDDKPAFEEKL